MFSSYFTRISKYPTFRFILEVTSLAFLSRFFLVLPAAVFLSAFGVDLGTVNIEKLQLDEEFIPTVMYAVVIAPFIETLVFQWIPLSVLRFIRIPVTVAIILTTLLFAYAHLEDGLINFIGMLPIGFLFVWAFIVRQRKSKWNAIFTVYVIHGLTNLFATVLYLLSL